VGYGGQDRYNWSIRHHKLFEGDGDRDQLVDSLFQYKNSGPSNEASRSQVQNHSKQRFFNLVISRPAECLPKGRGKFNQSSVHIPRREIHSGLDKM